MAGRRTTEPGFGAQLKVCFVTLMPDMFVALKADGVIGAAIKDGELEILCIDPRTFTHDRHRTVDDTPYGGGPGMVLKPEPVAAAIDHAKELLPQARVFCMTVDGIRFGDRMARFLAQETQLIIVCGRYQGIDERIMLSRVDQLVSLGDFVVSGGELPAMVMVDAIARFLPGVLGSQKSLSCESFTDGHLAPPCYTRPKIFEGMKVPDVLLTGNHARIAEWQKEQKVLRTQAWKDRQGKAG